MYEDLSTSDTINYKQKYHALKKKVKLLVYEQECFVEELRKSQKKLLKVSRDRSFLLDRLLQYEHCDASSSDSESTASSESVYETVKDNVGTVKKKRPNTSMTGNSSFGQSNSLQGVQCSTILSSSAELACGTSGRILKEPAKKKQKVARKMVSKGNSSESQSGTVHFGSPVKSFALNAMGVSSLPIPSSGLLSREEIERHLDLKHSSKPQFLSIDMMTPHSLPDDIFCHDNSNQDCPVEIVKIETEDTDLVIDMT